MGAGQSTYRTVQFSGTTTEIVTACAEAWNGLMEDPDRIHSVGFRRWATINV